MTILEDEDDSWRHIAKILQEIVWRFDVIDEEWLKMTILTT